VSSSIREYVAAHPLFCHHDHHLDFASFDAGRGGLDFRGLLGYAEGDLATAAGGRPDEKEPGRERIERLWRFVRTTGYGRAVELCCRELFGLEYGPANFDRITEALRALVGDRPAPEIYDELVKGRANCPWVIQDGIRLENDWISPGILSFRADRYPPYYRFAFRPDALFSIVDDAPIAALERASGLEARSLDGLARALDAVVDRLRSSVPLASFKIGIAYDRDLRVGAPTRHEAERAFDRIRNRKLAWGGVQQNRGAVNAREGRVLSDWLLRRFVERASDDDIPVQVHTGYLAGNWGALEGSRAIHLLPLFDTYRRVRFDIFHASWPWAEELGAIAKNYPNVHLDMCWAWTMSPASCERILYQWLDEVPFNKIFAFGADTIYPWCDVGYAAQARLGIGRVLERKVESGAFSEATAREVADAIMLGNGLEFYHLG